MASRRGFPLLQHPLEILPGVRRLAGGYLFRCAGDDDIAAAVAIPARQAARGPRMDFICSGGVNPLGIKVLPEAKRLLGGDGGRFFTASA